MNAFESAARQALKGAGLRITNSRIEVLHVLGRADRPLRVRDVLDALKRGSGEDAPDQVTVYRIVESFLEKGVVRRVNLEHDHLHVELHENVAGRLASIAAGEDGAGGAGDGGPTGARVGHHHHVVCTECGKVESIGEVDLGVVVTQMLERSVEFEEESHHAFEVFSVCRSCRGDKGVGGDDGSGIEEVSESTE